MSVRTEADCLLEQGALYLSRVLLRDEQDSPIFAGFKAGAFSLYYGDEPIFHFDLAGRWQRAYLGGAHFLKSLDTTVKSIVRVREGANLVLKRKTLSYEQVSDLDHQIRQAAIDLIDGLAFAKLQRVDPGAEDRHLDSETLRDFLERVVLWDAPAWFSQRERYLAAYHGHPFQPPDGVARIVVQASYGDREPSTFEEPRGIPHHICSPKEFETHVSAVSRLWGERIRQARAIYLSGSDILHLPADRIISYLTTLAQNFAVGRTEEGESGPAPLEEVHAFLEDPSQPLPTREDWQVLREHHLTRVYLGVESGNARIRSLYGKRWDNAELVTLVDDLKSAGMSISLLLFSAAGGKNESEAHGESTTELVEQLPLGPGDIVACLDDAEILGERDDPAGADSFSTEERLHQQANLRQRLLPLQKERKIKVVPYSLEKLWM